MPTLDLEYRPGLEGVVAAETRLSEVDGERGILILAGYPLEVIAGKASFEEVVHLLWYAVLPDEKELAGLVQRLARSRELPAFTWHALRGAAAGGMGLLEGLRLGLDTLAAGVGGGLGAEADQETAERLLAAAPVILAGFRRLQQGQEPVPPRTDLDTAAHFLYLLEGKVPSAARSRALETYLNTVVDHGLNASTFTARVIISTGSDLVSAVVGALGALKGPAHGGAPGPALDTVFEIGSSERAEAVLRSKLDSGERLMGFGHRVYKVRDPRAEVLSQAARQLYHADGDLALFELAGHVERTAIALLEEYKPGRRLQTNVEYYTALLLHGLGLPAEMFTAVFALSRMAGWIAHAFEQRRAGRLIRPRSVYTGERDRAWVPLSAR